MRVIIVGNGLAGTIAAKTLRELDSAVEIDIFTDEKYHYYPRPNLIEFLAGNLSFDKLFAFSEEWYSQKLINIHLTKPIKMIFPDTKEVQIEGGIKEKYDFLILANGSYAFIPPFQGVEKRGVFTLRTLDDACSLLEDLKKRPRVTVIGGGLLGLETARALKTRGAEVEVVEFFDRLLPRQLDVQGATLLKSQIEKMDIKIHIGLATQEIRGQEEVEGLKFKDGGEIKSDMAVVAAGVRPNLRLAQEAGLKTDRGLLVDDFLQTNAPEVYAAGDVVEHRERIYGIIPASFNQARIVASNILNQKKKYEGTIPSNTLKVMGIDLASFGLVNPEEEGYEEVKKEKKEEGIYKKLIIKNGVIVGAIWMGTKMGISELDRIISQKINIEKWKDSILEDDFDLSVI